MVVQPFCDLDATYPSDFALPANGQVETHGSLPAQLLEPPAAADAPLRSQESGHGVGDGGYPLARGLRRVLRDREALRGVLNARWRLRGVTRLPLSVRLTGRARIENPGRRGRIDLGERVNVIGRVTPTEIAVHPGGRITIGDGTFVNYGVSISAHDSVTIGADCQIGQYAIIQDNDYHDLIDKRVLPPSRPVVIEDRVWIGARVIVLRGVRIGHDAVVGAGSVVTRDVPPWTVVAGVPARPVRTIDPAARGER
jgi:maltose O-acetyltransferase